LVITLTDAAGHFKLDNLPTGTSFPLVMQIGKWRRQITIPAVNACTTTPLTDVNQQRLPRNQSEGDMPQLAIATGSADPFECLLLKMGIDPAEFTVPSGGGRVHMYYNANKPATNSPALQLDGGSPPASALWGDAGTLTQYDVVLLPCEGSEFRKTQPEIDNLTAYTSAGGRLFLTHYSYVWAAFSAPFNTVADWIPDTGQKHNPQDPFDLTTNTSFPKGQSFSTWLGNVGALNSDGTLGVHQSRQDVGPVVGSLATRWLSGTNNFTYADGGVPPSPYTPDATQHLTFNTPVGPAPTDGGVGDQCGRVVFSDFHVTTTALNDTNGIFPTSCKPGAFTPQEKALVFMLFDVSSCIQNDQKPPSVCPTVNQACSDTNPCCSGLLCQQSNLQACSGRSDCTCQATLN
jgi:hypothetical protein